MKLKDYAKLLLKYALDYPELDVIYAYDSDNDLIYNKVSFEPHLGFYKEVGVFNEQFNGDDDMKINAICLN